MEWWVCFQHLQFTTSLLFLHNLNLKNKKPNLFLDFQTMSSLLNFFDLDQLNFPPQWSHVNVTSNWVELVLDPDLKPLVQFLTQPIRLLHFVGPSSKVPLNLRPTLDKGLGSNFLGANLDWFEANWILELDYTLVISLILDSPNQELALWRLFFGLNQLIFPPKEVPCRFSLNLPLFGLGPLSKGLRTNLKLLTNKIAWIHWSLDLGPSSKVALNLHASGRGRITHGSWLEFRNVPLSLSLVIKSKSDPTATSGPWIGSLLWFNLDESQLS